MASVGWATLDVIPSVKGIAKELDKQTAGPLAAAGKSGGDQFGQAAGKSAGSRFGSVFKTAAKATLVGVAGLAAGAIKVGIDSVNLAADFEQSVGAVDAIFKDSSKQIHRWAEDAADDVGLTANEFNELGTLIGAQLKNGGTAMDELAPKTNELIGLGADLSSMFGGNTREAVEALSSALKGERDPIERYGVSLNQAKIDAEAAELGFKKVDGALGDQAKQAATLSLIMEQTADAHGNFAREADTLSGKQQRLKARIEDVKTEIGTALLPIVTKAADYLLEKGVPAFERFSDWFASDGIDGIKRFGTFARDEVLPVLEDIGSFTKDAAGHAADLVKALNDLPKPAKYAGLVALLGGGAALKLRGGGGGALGTLGRAAGLAKPTPVFVTNPGFGKPGGLGGGTPVVAGTPGSDPGKGGKGWSKAGTALGKAAGPLMAGVIGVSIVDALLKDNKILDPIGDSGAKAGDATRDFLDGLGPGPGGILGTKGIEQIRESIRETDENLGRLRSNLGVFGDEVDLVGNKKIDPRLTVPGLREERKNLERFYQLELDAGRPIEPNLKVLGYEPAMEKLYNLQRLKIGDKTLTIHTRYVDPGEPDYLSGGVRGARANGGQVLPRQPYLVGERGPEIFRPDGAGSIIANHEIARAGAGVQVSIGTVVAHDYDDFVQQTQRRAQRASLGGFGR